MYSERERERERDSLCIDSVMRTGFPGSKRPSGNHRPSDLDLRFVLGGLSFELFDRMRAKGP